MEVSGQLHVPAALPPGEDPQHPLDRRLGGGPRSWSGRSGEEKKIRASARNRTPVVQPVEQSLYWPIYRGSIDISG